MENSFEHAKEYAADFFAKLGHSLDHNNLISLMTNWAANFTNGEVKEAEKVDLDAITAPLHAEIGQLKALITSKDEAHAGAIADLQAAHASALTVATATPEPLAVTTEPEAPVKASKAKKAEA